MTKAANTGNGYPSGMKNRIINGGMDISQRGTTFTSPATNAYLLDRYRWNNTTDGAVTITQNSDVPPNLEFQNSLRVAVTIADASIAAGQIAVISQSIEGYNIRDLVGRTFTVSFWVRSTKTGIHCIALRNSVADRSYIAEYTISSSNTWEYKTITVTGGLPTAGTWDYTNGRGLEIYFSMATGSTYQTTTGAWNTGNLTGSANQANVMETIGNIFGITGVQIEAGSVATPFEHRHYGTELALCQRYYEKTFDMSITPAQNAGGAGSVVSQNIAEDGIHRGVFYPFKITKRAAPSVTSYNPSATNANVRNATRSADATIANIVGVHDGITYTFTGAAGSIAGDQNQVHFTAEAEL